MLSYAVHQTCHGIIPPGVGTPTCLQYIQFARAADIYAFCCPGDMRQALQGLNDMSQLGQTRRARQSECPVLLGTRCMS